MSSAYFFGQGVQVDVDEIWEYIALDDVDAADRWIAKLFDAFEMLAKMPSLGHTRDDLTDHPVLFWPVGAYSIRYRSAGDVVEIVAVTRSRDIPAFLRRRIH